MIVQNVSAAGRTDISFTVPRDDLGRARPILDSAAGAVEAEGGHRPEVAKVSLVGAGMKTHPGIAADMFDALADAGINMEIIDVADPDLLRRPGRRRGACRDRAARQVPARRGSGRGWRRGGGMKTSLGIWALGSMVTRFVPSGYQPQYAGQTTVERVRRAVDGLGDLMDDWSSTIRRSCPRTISTRCAVRSTGTASTALRPGFISTRCSAVAACSRIRRSARRSGARSPRRTSRASSGRTSSSGRESRRYNYPFQTPYADSWAWLLEGRPGREKCREHGVLLFLEHKNSEPAMKIFMRNIGMTLHVIHKHARAGCTT